MEYLREVGFWHTINTDKYAKLLLIFKETIKKPLYIILIPQTQFELIKVFFVPHRASQDNIHEIICFTDTLKLVSQEKMILY